MGETATTWDDYFRGAAAPAAAADAASDWGAYLAPGLNTPRAQAELRAQPTDKYAADAQQRYNWYVSKGITPPGTDLTYSVGRGAGFGWGDEIMAGAMTPLEMIRQRTLDPREAYRYGKAYQDLATERARAETTGNTAAELAGGLVGGAGVLGAGTRYGAAKIAGREIPAAVTNWTANTAKAAGMGSVIGAGEAENVEGIPKGMISGGILGAGVGGIAMPIIGGVARHGANLLQAPRLRNPEMVATERIAEAARNAGVSPEEMVRKVSEGHAAGQPYFVADAIGHEGQRLLAANAKVPGPQREAIVKAITDRNLNMPVRTGEEVATGLGAPRTARQAQAELEQRAETTAAPIYRQAEENPTWSNRLQEFLDHPDARKGLAAAMKRESRDAVAEGRAFNPGDYVITDFNSAGESVISAVPNVRTLQAVKKGLDEMIDANTDKITGHVNVEGRSLINFKNRMLQELDAINPTFREARATFADPMQIRNAVDRGREMKRTGRATDNIEEFRDMRSGEQQGIRIGYADALQQQLEATGNYPALLREKSVKGSRELAEFSRHHGPFFDPATGQPKPDPLRAFLNREEEMLKTSHKAIGGSSTIENAADVAAGPGGAEVLGLIANTAAGNVPAVGGSVLSMLNRARKGESEAQRVALTNALLTRDPQAAEELARRMQEWELRRRGVNPWTGEGEPGQITRDIFGRHIPGRGTAPRYREGD